jgi:hypothetical protein
LGDLLRRVKPDFDPTTAEVEAMWEAAQGEMPVPWETPAPAAAPA